MTPAQQKRLNDARTRVREARDKRNNARKARDAARTGGDVEVEGIAQATLDGFESQLEAAMSIEMAALSQASDARPVAESLMHNLDAQIALAAIAEGSSPLRSDVPIGPLAGLDDVIAMTGRSLEAAAVGVPHSGGASAFEGPIAPPATPQSLLDVFASVPFDARTSDVLRRSGVVQAAIAPMGSVKQEAAVTYAMNTVRAVVVATWVKANRADLDDVETLSADLHLALGYGVMREVERLLLDGAPSGPDGAAVPGILENPLEPTVTATTLAGAVGQMKAALLATGVNPTFAASNAATVEAEEARDGSDGHPINSIGDDGRIRRVPLISTEALDDGQILVGDSLIGAKLGVRQAINLTAAMESDDFIRNRVTLLVEGRWAPLVYVPTAFALHELA